MCTISGHFPIGATDQRRNGPFIELLRSDTASHPLCSEWLHVGDLPAAGGPLHGNPQPSGRKQWLRLAAPVGLLVDKHHHDRPIAIEQLDGQRGHGRHHHGLLPGRQLTYPANWRW